MLKNIIAMKLKIYDLEIDIEKGNIADQPGIDAVVNAANGQLAPGGGVAVAIHNAAGKDLYEECKSKAPIAPGEAVITKAYNLPNKFVIHTLGPIYGKDKPEDKILRQCYQNMIRLTEKHQIRSVAIPAISTGIFGYPVIDAVEVVFNRILTEAKGLKHLQNLKFVLFSNEDLKIYKDRFAEI